MKAEHSFKNEFDTRFPLLHDPYVRIEKVVLNEVHEDPSEFLVNWTKDLREWNNWPKAARLAWRSFVKTRIGFRVIIQVDSRIRCLIEENNGIIKTPLGTLNVFDHVNVILCDNCCQFNHVKVNCIRLAACGYCYLNHLSRRCSLKNSPSDFKCLNCSGNHSVFSKNCPVYLYNLQNQLEKVNHSYSNLIA